jgi:hypothetical protein
MIAPLAHTSTAARLSPDTFDDPEAWIPNTDELLSWGSCEPIHGTADKFLVEKIP